LPNDFVKGWQRKRPKPFSARFEGLVNPVPMRDRITQTVYKLNMVQRRLEDSETRLKAKDKELFRKCVKAQEAKDEAAATMYANEIAQLRKMAQTVIGCQMAIEQVVLRLETVRDFGDIATEILPAANIIRSIKDRVAGVLPEVSHTMGEISESLDSLVVEVGQVAGAQWTMLSTGEDAERILTEAALVAEQKMKEAFPTLPSAVDVGEEIKPP